MGHAADGLFMDLAHDSVINRFRGEAARDAGHDGFIRANGGDAPEGDGARAKAAAGGPGGVGRDSPANAIATLSLCALRARQPRTVSLPRELAV